MEAVDDEELITPGGRKEPLDGMSCRGISIAFRPPWEGNMFLLRREM